MTPAFAFLEHRSMIAFPAPYIDAALVVAMAIEFFALLVGALWVRPELNGGKKLDRMRSYAIGAGALLGSILLLELYRGIACECWVVPVPQLWIDSAGLALASFAATKLHRVAFGEPRRGNPHVALANYKQEVEKLTDGILDTDNQDR